MRIARRRVLRQPDHLEQLADPLRDVAASGQPVHAQRLADDPPDAVARVERCERILEDHLHPAPQRAQRALREVRDVLAVKEDPAAGRLIEAQDGSADGRLAAARLTDEPERLAALDRQADAVDGANVADVAVEDDAAANGKPHPQVLELYEIAASSRCHSSAGTGLKQATQWSRVISTSGGTSCRDRSTS